MRHTLRCVVSNTDIEEWTNVWYPEIARELGINIDKDYESARILADIVCTHPEPVVEQDLRVGVVLGAGPSLARCLPTISSVRAKTKWFAADGAARAVVKLTPHTPDYVVTDLDGLNAGDIPLLREAGFFVHAHGDNIPAVRRLVPEIVKQGSRLTPTCQCAPIPKVKNYFGFTDGDRAAWITHALGAEKIVLVGMDFGAEIGEFSKPPGSVYDAARKRKKLEIGLRLIERLSEEAQLYTLRGCPRIPGLEEISAHSI